MDLLDQGLLSPDSLGLGVETDDDPGQTLAQWIAEQEADEETIEDFVREMGLLEHLRVRLQLVEHYDDGTNLCVEKADWKGSEW